MFIMSNCKAKKNANYNILMTKQEIKEYLSSLLKTQIFIFMKFVIYKRIPINNSKKFFSSASIIIGKAPSMNS